MKDGITIEIKSNKCNNCSNDCKRRLEDKILCELRNNLTPKLNSKQVPETWEELKELCKGITVGLKICKDGTIYCNEYFLARNRTPAQMWQIINNLIGE